MEGWMAAYDKQSQQCLFLEGPCNLELAECESHILTPTRSCEAGSQRVTDLLAKQALIHVTWRLIVN